MVNICSWYVYGKAYVREGGKWPPWNIISRRSLKCPKFFIQFQFLTDVLACVYVFVCIVHVLCWTMMMMTVFLNRIRDTWDIHIASDIYPLYNAKTFSKIYTNLGGKEIATGHNETSTIPIYLNYPSSDKQKPNIQIYYANHIHRVHAIDVLPSYLCVMDENRSFFDCVRNQRVYCVAQGCLIRRKYILDETFSPFFCHSFLFLNPNYE